MGKGVCMSKIQKIKLFESLLRENTTATPFLDTLKSNEDVFENCCDSVLYFGDEDSYAFYEEVSEKADCSYERAKAKCWDICPEAFNYNDVYRILVKTSFDAKLAQRYGDVANLEKVIGLGYYDAPKDETNFIEKLLKEYRDYFYDAWDDRWGNAVVEAVNRLS